MLASVQAVEWNELVASSKMNCWWHLLTLQWGFTRHFGLFPAQSFQVSKCVCYSYYSWLSTLLRTSARLLMRNIQPWSTVRALSFGSFFYTRDQPQPKKKQQTSQTSSFYSCAACSPILINMVATFRPVLCLVKLAMHICWACLSEVSGAGNANSCFHSLKTDICHGLSYVSPCWPPQERRVLGFSPPRILWAGLGWAHQPMFTHWPQAGGASLRGLQRQHCKQQIEVRLMTLFISNTW